MPDIILVHGLWYRAWAMRILADRLAASGFRTWRFSYPTRKAGLERNAVALGEYCRSVSSDELHFIGHSLGGLVVLKMLQSTRQLPPGRIVLLGTPLRGSAVAGKSTGLPGGKFLMGLSAPALTATTALVDRETGMIAGTRPQGIGRLTGALSGANDGTVSVSETRSDELADRVELPVTHTGMLVSPRVAAQCAYFLDHGHFKHAG
jgi:pimeloyl-ACP methyl ester carboxylesterase